MPEQRKITINAKCNGATVGYEAHVWHMAKMNLAIRGLEGDAHQGGNVESVA